MARFLKNRNRTRTEVNFGINLKTRTEPTSGLHTFSFPRPDGSETSQYPRPDARILVPTEIPKFRYYTLMLIFT